MHEIVNARRPVVGDKVERDAATGNQGKVRLGDAAPVFAPRRPVMGDKVERDAATGNQGKVRLGDAAPVFGR
jgi:CRISPR/Cas system CMR subunit Cmr4 (Cas7 group RAMP superfamily)